MFGHKNRRLRNIYLFTTGAFFFGVGFGGAAVAQQSEPAQSTTDTSSPDIVVTASKLGADLEKAPVTAVAVSSEMLTRNNILSLNDMSARVPSFTSSKASNFAINYIRGVGSSFSLGGQESAVAVYVDGVYLQRQMGGVLDLVDLSNVTVLKGPQGTLYGRNATGGAILVETTAPADHYEAFLTAEYGRFDARRLQGAVNIPLDDNFAIRVSGQTRDGGGYFRDLNTGKMVGDEHQDYVRFKARWSPGSAFSATYSIEYFKQNAASYQQRELVNAPDCLACAIYPNVPVPGPDDFYFATMGPGHFNISSYVAQTLSLIYTADAFTLTSISGYRNQKSQLTNDSDNVLPDFAGNTIREKGPTFTNDTFLQTHLAGPVNGLLGFSYLRERDDQDFHLGGDAFASAGLSPFVQDKIRIQSYSVYGELTAEFGSGFKITGGARYNKDVKKIHVINNADAVLGLGIFAYPDAVDFRRRATFNSVTPRAVISYEKDGGYYYASHNRGEKSGAFPGPLYSPALPAADPERLDSFEIGAKNSFLGGRLRTTISAFYGKYKDIQVQILDNSTSTIKLQNAATAKVKGVEFTGDLNLSPAFSISFGGTYLKNKFNRFPDAAVVAPAARYNSFPGVNCSTPAAPIGFVGCQQDLSGTSLPFAPKWSGYISPQFVHQLANDWQIRLSANAKFTSKYLFAAGAGGPLRLDQQKGYTLVGSTLTIATPGNATELSAFVDNIFGVRHDDWISTSTFGTYAVASKPRAWGVRATQRF